MIAADTNLVVALLVPSHDTTLAREAFRKDSEWIAPLLWRSEFRNVLANLMRRGEMELADARRLSAIAERLFQGREWLVRSERVLELASKSGCTAYDCEFVTVAEEARVSLITDDRQILAAFPAVAIPLEDFAG